MSEKIYYYGAPSTGKSAKLIEKLNASDAELKILVSSSYDWRDYNPGHLGRDVIVIDAIEMLANGWLEAPLDDSNSAAIAIDNIQDIDDNLLYLVLLGLNSREKVIGIYLAGREYNYNGKKSKNHIIMGYMNFGYRHSFLGSPPCPLCGSDDDVSRPIRLHNTDSAITDDYAVICGECDAKLRGKVVNE